MPKIADEMTALELKHHKPGTFPVGGVPDIGCVSFFATAMRLDVMTSR